MGEEEVRHGGRASFTVGVFVGQVGDFSALSSVDASGWNQNSNTGLSFLRLGVDTQKLTALEMLGVGASRRGNSADAIDFLERAARLRPGDAGLLANLGAVYRMAGQTDEAEARFRKALSIMTRRSKWKELHPQSLSPNAAVNFVSGTPSLFKCIIDMNTWIWSQVTGCSER